MNTQRSKLKEDTYFVRGMHCASCELLIEKKLLEDKNVESVEASASDGKTVIFYKNKKPSVERLNREFKNKGYTFFEKSVSEKRKASFVSFKNGQLLINKKVFFQYFQILGVAFLLMIGFVLLNRLGIASMVVVNASSALPAFFIFGLIAGMSSCAALVGGIILSMSKQWSEIYLDEKSTWQRFQPHLLFNIGRLVSFGLFGTLLGMLGGIVQMSLTATSFLAIGVSVMMALLALQMFGVKYFQRFQINAPRFISRYVANEANFKGRYMPFLLGGLTFFLPCGFTITAQGLALASGNGLRGLLVMLFFALGTLPMLAAIGFSTLKLTAKPHLSVRFLKVAGILVLFFGFYNFNAQLNVLGLPSFDDINLLRKAEVAGDGLAPIINGRQVLRMDAFAYGYEPNELKVRTGIPVSWEIRNQGVSGCTNAIVSKGLFDGQIRLDKEVSVKDFTPQKPGRYKFSCWMGMISGTIIVMDKDGADQEFAGVGGEEVESGASGCGGGGSGGGCGNPGCPYARQ